MKTLTRRAIVGLGLASTFGRAFAQDRPQVDDGGGWFGSGNISCDNTDVPISDIRARISKVSDFAPSGDCVMSEDSFEGPYFFCTDQTGKDISGNREGAALSVALRVLDSECRPMPGAIVDIWACDARGNYAGYTASPDEFATSGEHQEPQTKESFCRGALATDADGIAEFDTIYPGFYAGRPIHIHFKIHLGNKAFVTNQALLPETVNKVVMKSSPYREPRGTSRVIIEDALFDEFATFEIVKRNGRYLALLTLGIES